VSKGLDLEVEIGRVGSGSYGAGQVVFDILEKIGSGQGQNNLYVVFFQIFD
jgi:hypothetical protein